jgi:hypothetical protein
LARIIEAKAVLSGEDKLSPVLEKLSKKFQQVEKTAKAGAAVDKMAASLAKVNTQVTALEKFNAAKIGFVGARENFRKAQTAVEAAARAMQNAQGPVRELEANYKRAQSAVQAASRAFEAQKSAVLGAKRSLAEAGIPLSRITAEQTRLAAAVNKANAALDRQLARRGRGGAGGVSNFSSNILPFAGPAVLQGTKNMVLSGAQLQSEVVKMRAAGIPEADIQRELGKSAEYAQQFPNVRRRDTLERYKELRSVLLHPEEASTLLPTVVKANSALNSLDKTGHMAEGLQFAVKGAEVLGLAQDPKRFEAYLDSFIRARQVMGDTITPETIYDLATNLKASGAALSDRFKFTTGLSLAQEMRGNRAGTGIDQLIKQVVGGFQGSQHSAAKEFVALGLADRDDFLTTKTGEIKGLKPGRHVAGSALAQSDPDQWVWKYVIPAMEKAGITDQSAQIAQVRRMFPSARAADIVSKLITQRPSFENHALLFPQAKGMDAALDTNKSDPIAALNALTTSLGNFAATLTSPGMADAAKRMNELAGFIGWLSSELAKQQKDHPIAAEVAGDTAAVVGTYYGVKWTMGMVRKLLGGGGAGKAGEAVTGEVAGAETGAGGAVARILGAIRGGAIPSALGVLEMMKFDSEHGNPLRTRLRTFFGIDDPHEPAPWMPGGSWDTKGGGGAAAPELHGKVTGEAKITIDIPGVGTRDVNVPLRGTVSANGPGSLGTSSPDAAAQPIGLGHR